jgi:hypothetical protein
MTRLMKSVIVLAAFMNAANYVKAAGVRILDLDEGNPTALILALDLTSPGTGVTYSPEKVVITAFNPESPPIPLGTRSVVLTEQGGPPGPT